MSANVLDDLVERWCGSFGLEEVDSGVWSVVSPMLYGDGDGLPVFITHSGGEWALTDLGMATSHLFFDDFEYTAARLQQLQRAVESTGASIDGDHRITFGLDEAPTVFDIGDFFQVVAQVQGVARSLMGDTGTSRYRTQLRESLSQMLEEHYLTEQCVENWVPETSGQARYRVDLKLPTDGDPVALFVASTSDRARSAAIVVDQCRRSDVPIRPLLAYKGSPQMADDALLTFRDYAGDEQSSIEVDANAPFPLARRLSSLGVPVTI